MCSWDVGYGPRKGVRGFCVVEIKLERNPNNSYLFLQYTKVL